MRDWSGETQVYVRWQKAAEEQKRFDKAKTLSCLASRDHPAALYPLRHMTGNPEIIPDPKSAYGRWRPSGRMPCKLSYGQVDLGSLGGKMSVSCPRTVHEQSVKAYKMGQRELPISLCFLVFRGLLLYRVQAKIPLITRRPTSPLLPSCFCSRLVTNIRRALSAKSLRLEKTRLGVQCRPVGTSQFV
jgi:hypothetical protein